MIINKVGNILNAEENIICHQVNINGVMGGGLARQIAQKYPEAEKIYHNFCERHDFSYKKLAGEVQLLKINNRRGIANCFTQKENFDTDYRRLKKCFARLLKYCKQRGLTVAVPHKYGCGIANGDWNIVLNVFRELSKKYNVDVSVYKYLEV